MTVAERRRRKANIKAGRHPREVLLRVPNAPLREHFLELYASGQVTAVRVAETAGWMRHGRDGLKGDALRLRRTLGIAESTRRKGDETIRYIVEEIEYDIAVLLCHAMHADPPAVGV